MPRFSANLGFLWPELSLVQRIHAAKSSRFEAVEFHWPYDTDPGDICQALWDTGLPLLSINTLPGDLAAGEFGLAALPGKQQAARQGIDQAIDYAHHTGAKNIHVMAGLAGSGDQAMAVFQENLDYAARRAAHKHIGIIIEPINRVDRPHYSLYKVEQAIAVIQDLKRLGGHQNIGIMFDCYHVQITQGNLSDRLAKALPYISHIQIAAVPGRAEPDQGEIDYPWLFNYIDSIGYTGYIGAEYIPATTTSAGLNWYHTHLGATDKTNN